MKCCGLNCAGGLREAGGESRRSPWAEVAILNEADPGRAGRGGGEASARTLTLGVCRQEDQRRTRCAPRVAE
mgnify:CR=1 FL=1